MWQYCPRCSSVDQPEIIPVTDVSVSLEGVVSDRATENTNGVPSGQKSQYRAVCERCGHEEVYDDED